MNEVGISLGGCCLPGVWGVHHNYRKSKLNNYLTCPFDLMVSSYESVVKCILEDFKHFTDPLYLKCEPMLVNTYYNFTFNHETPGHANLHIIESWEEGQNHFINNNYKHFIDRYNRRISNFKHYLSNDNFITFIICDCSHIDIECTTLRAALLLKYPNLKYKIIIINGPHPHIIDQTNIIKIIEQ